MAIGLGRNAVMHALVFYETGISRLAALRLPDSSQVYCGRRVAL